MSNITKLFSTVLFICLLHAVSAQTFDLGFEPTDFNCESNSVCFDVTIQSTSTEFDLGSYNLRLFYDASSLDSYIQGSAQVVNETAYNLIGENIKDMQVTDAAQAGSISFDDNLGFLSLPIEFNDEKTPIAIANNESTTLLNNVCFVAREDLSESPTLDLNTVWVTEKTNENYTASVTTINVAKGFTTDIKASSYGELVTRNNTPNSCFQGKAVESESVFSLDQNSPNPFIEKTNIDFTIPKASEVSLRIFDLNGKTVKEVTANFEAGAHSILVDDIDSATGQVLYYTLTAGDNSATRKMIVTK